jgi:two-component system OmpR family sensor kinase
MTTSIRTRLWWSHVLVIASALAVVAALLFIYIIQNPSTYRIASARLTAIASLLRKNENTILSLTPAQLQAQVENVDNNYDVRVIIFNNRRQIIADSRQAEGDRISMPLLPRLRLSSVLRDQNNNPWLYILQHIGNSRWLMVAIPRPSVPLLTILGDQLMLPILGSAGVALLISLFVAYWLSRWIGNPLQRVIAASRNIPSENTAAIALHGPREVQELAQAFNEMKDRVLATQKSQRDLVANVSHELKTPLTSIQGFSQAILDETANDPSSRQQAARIIYDEAGRMNRMVMELLDLARLDAGTFELHYAEIDMAALLKNIVDQLAPQAQSGGLKIHMETAPLPPIMGDGDRLAQVFTNLIDNAIKNTPAGGQLSLRASKIDSELQIEVMDTGNGIPPEALPHIFDRFYQADASRPGGKKHGAGLGLAIAREIVEAHGGKIGVRSKERPGLDGDGVYGSTFTVTLPLTIPGTSTVVSKRKKKS